ncbi:iron complex transport system ATP-binding protein [Candidatus Planktophila versatilis]|uniref:Iron complex transport system ATP-binding protein n=1 Tax=Candidatus Planktophila versatilis TaxID=1884905 RepID=A0AAC9YVJ7_9ACTN|nr:ABC transporter ATP-binding protein [Candidatus Planktophila versatilis]ASY22424.1 iron complex transport system ATP-binding protein [Candidatus Planktophila versatilis]
MALITIEKVSIIRGGKNVLTDFSASIEPGKITAIIGPNGSGKSTLLGALAGDLPIASGMITIAGRDLKEISVAEQAQLRSVVLQNRNYWLSYTARELIEMGQGPAELARVDAVMQRLDMTRYENQSVTTLSGGETQRVEIARALIRDTPIYLLDEPLSAQDVQSKARIIALLQELRDQGRTVLVIAHIDKSSLSWCDQIIDTLAQ